MAVFSFTRSALYNLAYALHGPESMFIHREMILNMVQTVILHGCMEKAF